mmetsp:Transcript_31751/g.71836  ORF Transcript_31751/g.71836 Transcript_31751/m.71836 type:complete len:228 (+) Transcript_31751:423-1106(+)
MHRAIDETMHRYTKEPELGNELQTVIGIGLEGGGGSADIVLNFFIDAHRSKKVSDVLFEPHSRSVGATRILVSECHTLHEPIEMLTIGLDFLHEYSAKFRGVSCIRVWPVLRVMLGQFCRACSRTAHVPTVTAGTGAHRVCKSWRGVVLKVVCNIIEAIIANWKSQLIHSGGPVRSHAKCSEVASHQQCASFNSVCRVRKQSDRGVYPFPSNTAESTCPLTKIDNLS